MQQPEFDVVIYGATGFTGRLVADVFAGLYPPGGAVSWALAGRDQHRLEAVRAELSGAASVPIVVADAADPDALAALARRTRVVLTTVGPYQLYGEPILAACVEAGAGYVDLCGEPAWMRRMIDAYDQRAKETGARIVFSCGFDSVPFDLGVFFLQAHAQRTFGAPAPRVKGRVRMMKGSFSGGTKASFEATMAAAMSDPEVISLLRSSFALTPGFEGPPQPSGAKPIEDPSAGSWAAPFIMAAINTKNVHRSNAVLGFPYGRDFVYDEMILTGPDEAGRKAAEALAAMDLLGGKDGPKPGEGPSREERESGFFDVLFIGEAPDGRMVRASVKGDRDPGYGSTSRMIAQCALCLALDVPALPGGVYTPAAAFGDAIIARLIANAGLAFTIEA